MDEWYQRLCSLRRCRSYFPVNSLPSKSCILFLKRIPRNKPLAVIGGGDSAAEEATCPFSLCLRRKLQSHLLSDLTKYGSHVYVLVRRDELRASKIMAKRLLNNPKVVRQGRCVFKQ